MFGILIFFGVLAVTVLLLGGWATFAILRFARNLLFGAPSILPPIGRICLNTGCGTDNPRHAKFCRRCGAPMLNAVSGDYRNVTRTHRRLEPERMRFRAG